MTGQSNRQARPAAAAMLAVVLVLCGAGTAAGQGPFITQGPYIGNVTRTAANATWVTDLSASTRLLWAYSAGALNPMSCQASAGCYDTGDIGIYTDLHTYFTGPTTPGTTIYYQTCSTDLAGEIRLTVTNGGAGYTHTPTVALVGNGYSGVSAAVNGGAISGAWVTYSWGYSSSPSVTVTPLTLGGYVSVSNGGTLVVIVGGVGTFDPTWPPGTIVTINGVGLPIATASVYSLTLQSPYAGTSNNSAPWVFTDTITSPAAISATLVTSPREQCSSVQSYVSGGIWSVSSPENLASLVVANGVATMTFPYDPQGDLEPNAKVAVTGSMGGTLDGTFTLTSVTSSTATFPTTAADGTYSTAGTVVQIAESLPRQPVPVTPVDTPVTPTGTVWTVGSDCNNPSTGLQARWNQAAADGNPNGEIVEIPATTLCASFDPYVFPAHTGPPYILTRVQNADKTFPNKRRANPGCAGHFGVGENPQCQGPNPNSLDDRPNMARFIETSPTLQVSGGTPAANGVPCFGGYTYWQTALNNEWGLWLCSSTTPRNITAIPTDGILNLTVPAHGYTTDSVATVSGVTGPGASAMTVGLWAHIIDANTIQLQAFCYAGALGGACAALASTGLASGGTIQLNAWGMQPVTEGTFLPATCTPGAYWHLASSIAGPDEYHRTWYCNASGHANEWVPLTIDPIATPNHSKPFIDLTTNSPSYVMFQGFNVEPIQFKANPQLLQYQGNPGAGHTSTGSTFTNFLSLSITSNHVYLDNWILGCPDPDLNGVMVQCAAAMGLDATHWHVGGSYFYGFQNYMTLNDLDDSSAMVLASEQSGPHEITNSYIDCAGICYMHPGVYANTDAVTDLTFTRNYVNTPDKYWDPAGPLLTQGFYFSSRHRLEFKQATRALIDGNVFANGFVWVNQAQALCLCTRGGGGLPVSAITANSVTSTSPMADLQVGDKLALFTMNSCASPNEVVTVTGIVSIYQVNTTPTGCATSVGGQVGRINARSNNISDVLMRNNTILNSPSDWATIGHDTYTGFGSNGQPSSIMRRIEYSNNLSIDTNGSRVGQGQYHGDPGGAPSGSHLVAQLGFEDLIWNNNTSIGRVQQNLFDYDSTGGIYHNSSFLGQNNLGEYTGTSTEGPGAYMMDGSSFLGGTAALNADWIAGAGGQTSPSWSFLNNAILRAGGSSGVASYPASTFWYDGATYPYFYSQARNNFRIQPCIGAPGPYTQATCPTPNPMATAGNDGTAVGIDADALEASQGLVKNARVYNVTGTSASVGWWEARDVCSSVDWSTDGFATYTRVNNSSGPGVQSVALSGLPAHTTGIQYRINCPVTQPLGSFRTQ